MRIIGYIEHPGFKITVFKMDDRISVKFENGVNEQTYKFRSGEGIDGLSDVQAWATPELLEQIESIFQTMEQTKREARPLMTSRDNSPPDVFEII